MIKSVTLFVFLSLSLVCMGCGDATYNSTNSVANAKPPNTNSANVIPVNTVTNSSGNAYKHANISKNSNLSVNSKPSNANTQTISKPTPKVDDSTAKKEEGQFSFPPAKATSFTIKRGLEPISAIDYLAKLENELKKVGFKDDNYFTHFSHNNEFALVTKFEQIDEEGNSLTDEKYRWSEDVQPSPILDIRKYSNYLFQGKKAFYRVFAFVVTQENFNPKRGTKITFEIAKNWIEKGDISLSENISGNEETPGLILNEKYKCYGLIYIFEKHTSKEEVFFVDNFGIDANSQFQNLNINF